MKKRVYNDLFLIYYRDRFLPPLALCCRIYTFLWCHFFQRCPEMEKCPRSCSLNEAVVAECLQSVITRHSGEPPFTLKHRLDKSAFELKGDTSSVWGKSSLSLLLNTSKSFDVCLQGKWSWHFKSWKSWNDRMAKVPPADSASPCVWLTGSRKRLSDYEKHCDVNEGL